MPSSEAPSRDDRTSARAGGSSTALEVEPPIFIMGCRRSGTTLVSQILDSHSRIAVYHETHYYPLFRSDLPRYGDLRRPSNRRRLIRDLRELILVQGVEAPEAADLERELLAPTFAGLLATLLHLYARQQGKVRSGEKTPEHYGYLPQIRDDFPASPVIFVMRDPRDTALSIHKAFDTRLESAIVSWNQAFESYRRAAGEVHLVRYEELVQNPTHVVEGICAFLGETFEPAMFRFFERIPERFRALPNVGKLATPVDASSIGKFRELSAAEIDRIETGCGAGMEAMGYPFSGVRPRPVERPAAETAVPKMSLLHFVLDRVRYYRGRRDRLRRGMFRWKLVLRLRLRDMLTLGPLRRRLGIG